MKGLPRQKTYNWPGWHQGSLSTRQSSNLCPLLSQTLLQARLRYQILGFPAVLKEKQAAAGMWGAPLSSLQDKLTWGKMDQNKTDYSIRRKSLSREFESCRPPPGELRDHHRRTDLRTPLLGPDGTCPALASERAGLSGVRSPGNFRGC